MVAIKTQSADSWLAKPPANSWAVLLFGPDTGAVAERASKAVAAFQARTPGAELIRLDDTRLTQEPAALAIELGTVSMFGEARIVRLRNPDRLSTDAIAEALSLATRGPNALIIEAGELRPAAPLRKAFEAHATAAAIACYADTAVDITRLIDQVLGDAGLTIAPDAKAELQTLLGADRLLSRMEIEKLALYAHGRGQVSLADVQAAVGDASAQDLDGVVVPALCGRAAEAAEALDLVLAAGHAPYQVQAALGRELFRCHDLRAATDRGLSADHALRQARPPVHFTRQRDFLAIIKRWSTGQLLSAIADVQDTIARSRTTPDLETMLTERLVLKIATHKG